ncbi:CaiB/BaiF CoA transferase family protein, partial [Chloroflexota bacterium]
MQKGLLLSGVRIVEVGSGWVGPWAGQLLADLGAELIKVESTTIPDFNRGPGTAVITDTGGSFFCSNYPDGKMGEKVWNRNSLFNAANFGKCDVTLDLTKTRGLELFMQVIKASDVFFSNMAVGVDKKLGIDYEAMVKVNPEIIYLTSAGFGRTGPYAKRVAMGNTIDAASGFFGLRGYGDGDSTAVTPSTHCDDIAAMTNAFSIVAALYHKKKTGKGMYIDTSMVEPSMLHIGEAIMDYTMNCRVQQSTGNRDVSMSPQGCYRCQGEDEWVTLSIKSDKEWQRFVEAMGNPQWAQDENFSNVLGRLKNQDELDKLIESWTTNRNKHEVMHLLKEAGIAAGAVLDNSEVYNDPHLKERGFWVTVDNPDAGVHTYPGRLWKLEDTEMTGRRRAPTLGEHNNYVLQDILGLTAGEVAVLEQEGI